MTVTDDDSRALRRAWFDYLDAVEAVRKPLHAYGLRLTGNVWDAEDLVQEALLRGFAMIGRGDLHGSGSPVANARAYLFRIASHLVIDAERRRARERAHLAEPQAGPAEVGPEAVRDAGERLFASASPQARAAVLLKDVFGFSLEETADLLRTTTGAVKAALHRGREGLGEPVPEPRVGPPKGLIDAFVDAYNAKDVARLLAVVTETVSLEVLGVGGGRGLGPQDGWAQWALQNPVRAEPSRLDGEDVVVFLFATPDGDRLVDVLRLEGLDGRVSRIVDHSYAADTMDYAAGVLGTPNMGLGYHQGAEDLTAMIASTTRPWDSAGIVAPAPAVPV